ncbi:hypothetical protein TNCV_1439361 [Trichonephila clavipes]|nr:hypothetical protein TNCV_1439361 [Trichonephila clavipes]
MQSSYQDSNDENEMKNVALVPMSPEMRNIVKSIRSYLDAHFNGGINKKIDDIGIDAKEDDPKKNISDYFTKTQ